MPTGVYPGYEDQFERLKNDPRRDENCDGCQMFGICIIHSIKEPCRQPVRIEGIYRRRR